MGFGFVIWARENLWAFSDEIMMMALFQQVCRKW